MTFGEAYEAAKEPNTKITRPEWNGKVLSLILLKSGKYFMNGRIPNTEDRAATDWEIVGKKQNT